MSTTDAKCAICGEPMPEGEQMFKFHGYSGSCPKPPLPVPDSPPEAIMQFFTFEHLPPDLREVSRPFATMAQWMSRTLPRNPERSTALRKLLEAKDAAVRARLFK